MMKYEARVCLEPKSKWGELGAFRNVEKTQRKKLEMERRKEMMKKRKELSNPNC